MPKISDLVEQETGEKIGLPGAAAETIEEELEPVGPSINFEWLRTPTGDGSIESYMDHPLNFQRSRGLAQVLRGLTGIVGDLKLAIVDIIMGGLNYAKERRTNAPEHTIQG